MLRFACAAAVAAAAWGAAAEGSAGFAWSDSLGLRQSKDLASLCQEPPGSSDCTIVNQTATITTNGIRDPNGAVLSVNGTVSILNSTLTQVACTVLEQDCGMIITAANLIIAKGSIVVGNRLELTATGDTLNILDESVVDVSCASRYSSSYSGQVNAGVGYGGIGGGHGGAGSGNGEDKPCNQAIFRKPAGSRAGTRGVTGQPDLHWGGDAFGFSSIRSPRLAGGGSCTVTQVSGPRTGPTAEEVAAGFAAFTEDSPAVAEAALRTLASKTGLSDLLGTCPARGDDADVATQRLKAARSLRWAGRLAEAARHRLAPALEDEGRFAPLQPTPVAASEAGAPTDWQVLAIRRAIAELQRAAAHALEHPPSEAGPLPSSAQVRLAGNVLKSCWPSGPPLRAREDTGLKEGAAPLHAPLAGDDDGTSGSASWVAEDVYSVESSFVPGGGIAVVNVDKGTLVVDGTSILADGATAGTLPPGGAGSGGSIDVQAGAISVTVSSKAGAVAFSAMGGDSAFNGGGGGGIISLGTPSFQGLKPSWFNVNGGSTKYGDCEYGGGGVVYLFPNDSASATNPPKLWCMADAAMKRRAVTVVPAGSSDLFNASVNSPELILKDCNWQMSAYSTLFASSLQMVGSSLEVTRIAMTVTGGIELSLNSQLAAAEVGGKLTLQVKGGLSVASSLIKSDTLHIQADNITIDAQSYVHFASTAYVQVGGLVVNNDLTQSDIPTTPTQLTLMAGDVVIGKSGSIAASMIRLVSDTLTIKGQVSADTVTVSDQCSEHGPAKHTYVPPDADTTAACNFTSFNASAGFAGWVSASTMTLQNGGAIIGSTVRVCAHILSVDKLSGITSTGMGCPANSGLGAGGYSTGVPGGGAGHGGDGGAGMLAPSLSRTAERKESPPAVVFDSVTLTPTHQLQLKDGAARSPARAQASRASTASAGMLGAIAPLEPWDWGAIPTPILATPSGTPTPSPTSRPSSSPAPVTGSGGVAYDNAARPLYVGSGGGGTGAFGGAGGGLLMVSANVATIDGAVKSDGAPGAPSTSSAAAGGGGSGGSVVLQMGRLSGAGAVSAVGGAGGAPGGGGGGGGVVLIVRLVEPLRLPTLPGFQPREPALLTNFSGVDVLPPPDGPIVPGGFSGQVLSHGGLPGGPSAGSGDAGRQESSPKCTDLGFGTAMCSPCEPGTYKNTTGSSVCTPCPAGTYASNPATVLCLPCGPGNFSNAPHSEQCFPCPDGYIPDAGHTECSICDAGYQSMGRGLCVQCSAGHAKPFPGDGQCKPCAPGMVARSKGETSCVPCDAGTISAKWGSSECTDCDAGTFSDENRSSCELCRPGFFSPDQADACSSCPVNTFSHWGAPGCTECLLGWFADANASRCQACPPIPEHAAFIPRAANRSALLGGASRRDLAAGSVLAENLPGFDDEFDSYRCESAAEGDAAAAPALRASQQALAAHVDRLACEAASVGVSSQRCDFECNEAFVDYPHCLQPWQVVMRTLGGFITAIVAGSVFCLVGTVPQMIRWCRATCAVNKQRRKSADGTLDFRHAAAALAGRPVRGSSRRETADGATLGLLAGMDGSGNPLGRSRRGSTGSRTSINGGGGADSSRGQHYRQPLLSTRGTGADGVVPGYGDRAWGFVDDVDDYDDDYDDGDDLATPVGGGGGGGVGGPAATHGMEQPFGRSLGLGPAGMAAADPRGELGSGAGGRAHRGRSGAGFDSALTMRPVANSEDDTDVRSAISGSGAEAERAIDEKRLVKHARSIYRGARFAKARRREVPWSRLRTRRADLDLFLHRLYFSGTNRLGDPWRARPNVPPELYSAVLHEELHGLQRAVTASGQWTRSQRRISSLLCCGCHPGFLLWRGRAREAKTAEVAAQMDPFVERLFRNPRARMLGSCLKFGASPCRTLGWVDVLVQDREDAGGAPIGIPRDTLVLPFCGTGDFDAPFRIDLDDILARTAIATMMAPWLPERARFVTDLNDALRTVHGSWLHRAVHASTQSRPTASRFRHRTNRAASQDTDAVGLARHPSGASEVYPSQPERYSGSGEFGEGMSGEHNFDDFGSEADVDGDAARAETQSPRLAMASMAGRRQASTLSAHTQVVAEPVELAVDAAAEVAESLTRQTMVLLRDVQQVIALANRALRANGAPYRACLGVTSAFSEPVPEESRLALVLLSTAEEALARRTGTIAYLAYDTVLLFERSRSRTRGAVAEPTSSAALVGNRLPTVQRIATSGGKQGRQLSRAGAPPGLSRMHSTDASSEAGATPGTHAGASVVSGYGRQGGASSAVSALSASGLGKGPGHLPHDRSASSSNRASGRVASVRGGGGYSQSLQHSGAGTAAHPMYGTDGPGTIGAADSRTGPPLGGLGSGGAGSASVALSPIAGLVAFAVGSSSVTRLHASINVVSSFPALIGSAVLIGMFIATDPTTRGTALKPLPMVLDIWVGVVAPAAWLVVKFYLAHVLPSRVAALETARDSDIELFVMRKQLGSALKSGPA
ncbi:hypothetical protein FNF31_00881 [Cafeteria roenbergensis]|uniref:Tyrosine-protein kinase ephrin type A/B receptor-like domain-containing protein n=1 Tax=Cafeteria roenbergensis TaxID=33653 RepID=A0A5A8DUG9_CAFRO|nr:hypothetical protein FNF31_00881 [Cafeteria roenbergensis]KAA0172359.1 hypothetical protein FNF28_00043 [Cafeteria roenbergensis]